MNKFWSKGPKNAALAILVALQSTVSLAEQNKPRVAQPGGGGLFTVGTNPIGGLPPTGGTPVNPGGGTNLGGINIGTTIISPISSAEVAVNSVASSVITKIFNSGHRTANVFTHIDTTTDKIYTFQPMGHLGAFDDAQAIEIYKQAQVFAKKSALEYASKSLINILTGTTLTKDQQNNLAELSKKLQSGEMTPDQLQQYITTHAQLPSDFVAMDTLENQSNLSIQQEIDAFEKVRPALYMVTAPQFMKNLLNIRTYVPSAAMASLSFKWPDSWVASAANTPYVGKALQAFMTGSITYGAIVRPWRVTITDRFAKKGVVHAQETVYLEVSPKIWYAIDRQTGNLQVNEKQQFWRLSVGGVFGDINDLQKLTGGFAAVSKDMILTNQQVEKAMVGAQEEMTGDSVIKKVMPFKINVNVKAGFIGSIPQMGQFNGNLFVSFGVQKGVLNPATSSHLNFGFVTDPGGLINFLASTMRWNMDPVPGLLIGQNGYIGAPTNGTNNLCLANDGSLGQMVNGQCLSMNRLPNPGTINNPTGAPTNPIINPVTNQPVTPTPVNPCINNLPCQGSILQ